MSEEETLEVWDSDAGTYGGYIYTTTDQLSSRLARARQAWAIVGMTNMKGRTLLDLGCGDGYYTRLIYDAGDPASIVGIDPAANAIEAAVAGRGDRRIEFSVGDGHSLPFEDKAFEVVLVQGVLHHNDHPADLVREACRLGREVIILEPNGYSPVLKLIEKTSSYHRRHKERSYPPSVIDAWLATCGGRVVRRRYSCVVPMFAPDALARVCKAVEPIVEATPGVRRLCCSNYTVKALVD